MAKTLHLLTVSFVILLYVAGCRYEGKNSVQPDLSAEVSSLIGEATRDLSNQDFDAAMEKALHALEISRTGKSFPLGEIQALYTIIGIDIMSSRDADAWEKAVEAEAIARKHGFDRNYLKSLSRKPNCVPMQRFRRRQGGMMKDWSMRMKLYP